MKTVLNTVTHTVDLCVVGGGLAGMCAAIAAARRGSRVVLMHERPMLGGNASSEIRMWVCGAQGENNRETGIIEEICLQNLHDNPDKQYSRWDGLLFEKVKSEPNITLLLNCSCCAAETDGDRIVSVTGWQLTTQQWHRVEAHLFSDCSGDSILAPLTGAEFRVGREPASEFGEKMSQQSYDTHTMGMSCLIQARRTDKPTKFVAPSWATKLDVVTGRRKPDLHNEFENFWYLELGGDRDSIADTETVRDELIALAYGMWDYVKNSGQYPDADYYVMDFLGFLPGKRESRRMVGPYIMTQLDVLSGGHFSDVIAYGGWGLDDHDPRGFYHAGGPNVWGDTPSPYGIPYRCVYSANISNLFFAGRNISLTHAAMSSARVMATCAILGEAVGAAAALCTKYECLPADISASHIDELQQSLMQGGCFLPGLVRRVSDACLSAAFDGSEALRRGMDRTHALYGDHSCTMLRIGEAVTYTMPDTYVSGVRVALDSDLNRVTLPGSRCERIHSMRCNLLPDSPTMHMPLTLARDLRVCLTYPDGSTETLTVTDNMRQIVFLPVERRVTAVSLVLDRGWDESAGAIGVLAFDFD